MNDDYIQRYSAIKKRNQELDKQHEMVKSEMNHSIEVLHNTRTILDDLDTQFCRKTGLTELDTKFLFLAVGLQIARQYLLTYFADRLDDQTAANQSFKLAEEHSNRKHKYYQPSFTEIYYSPVPFDANIGADGALSGGGKLGHRVTAIGHDPVLGLIVGTANIATSTLTTFSFESFHIYTNENNRDYFKSHARTDLVFKYTIDKLLNQGLPGKKIIGLSLLKEIIHLQSDVNSTNSLPFPIVSVIDPKYASELASYGLDMANTLTIGKQATYAHLINSLIAMIHRMFYDCDNEMEKKLFEVRTRKILSYSNLIASSSNLAVVAITGNFQLLDVGGIAVAIHRLISDKKFIQQVKEEFIFGQYKDIFLNANV